MDQKFVLIDTDGGCDDCLALFVALAAHKNPQVPLKIVGITCVNGNTTLENVCLNTTRVLQTADVNDVPIFAGCPNSMVTPYSHMFEKPPFYGWNGFNDVKLPYVEPKIEEENGVLALIRLAKEYKGQLSIVALGPLTNLAMAVRLDPSIRDCIKEIYLMGGSHQGVGNSTISVEFNFFVDPDSAFVTLHSFPCPISIVPWELCKRLRPTFMDFRLNSIGQLKTPEMSLLNLIETKNLTGSIGWSPIDAICLAVFLQPSLIDEFQEAYCTVELQGKITRGLLAIDHDGRLGNPTNARIVISTHDEGLKELLFWAVGGQTKNPLINL